jgi:hypothetical protein
MISCRSLSTIGVHRSWTALGSAFVLALWAWQAEAADVVTVESLLGRMTDTRWLATPPQVGERTVQFSSYDRASRLVDGRIINPFANGDRGHYLRVEGEGKNREWVLAEARGPGYVSRIWSANPDGELRIYVDGSKTPALAAAFAAITNGEVKPFETPFGHDASRGRNLYFPFPFAKSIKTSTTKGDQYFQVSVTTLPEGTKVESYSPEVLKRASGAIKETANALLNPPFHSRNPHGKGKVLESPPRQIQPGKFAVLASGADSGGLPGAINRLCCKVEGAADPEDALARTLLMITFDDAPSPQVAVPLGDFFGSGPGISPFSSAINWVQKDGTMVAGWYMPYRKSVRVVVGNFTDQTLKISGCVSFDPTPPPDQLLYFHARWRYQDNLQTKKADGTLDWPALRVSGASGRFVGLLLNVFNPTPAWWGEGDEKIYVDGESFPSTFGTGTEDYFGYAWSNNHTYMNPFHAQTRCDGPGNKGNSSNIRYQILDSVPFQKSLNFDLEVWHWEAVKVQYATMAYFYAAPGARIEPGIPDLSTRKVYPKPPIKREPGVVEGEDLKVKTKTAGDVPNQDMTPFGDAWSGASQLWWVVHEAKARLDLELPVKMAGTYAIWAAFTKAGDYGTVQLAIDNKPLGDPIDLYAPFPSVLHTGAVPLGTAMLDAGPQALSITVTGKNPQSTNYLVGMDWIKLTPARAGSFPGRNEGGNRR